MVYYGPWQDPLVHTYRWNALGGSGGRIYSTGPETPHPGLTATTGAEWRGGAFYAQQPRLPLVYQDSLLRAAVYESVNAGSFQPSSPDRPAGNVPGTITPGGTDDWVGGSSSPAGSLAYKFTSLDYPPSFVGDIQASAFRTQIQAGSNTMLWTSSVSQPNYPPDVSRWPVGAIGVDYLPGGAVEFVECIIEPTIGTSAASGVAGAVTAAMGFRYPGSGMWHAYRHGDPQPNDPPSQFRSVSLVSGETSIPDFDLIREYRPSGSGDPDWENEVSLLFAPSGFFPGGAVDPALTPGPAANSELNYAINLAEVWLRITFKTNAYRYIYAVAPFLPVGPEEEPENFGADSPATPVARTRLVQ